MRKRTVIVFALLLLLSAMAPGPANAAPATLASQSLNRQLAVMHGSSLFSGGTVIGGDQQIHIEKVTFDVATARATGYSEQAITLAVELASFTNELVATISPERPGIGTAEVDLSAYPAVDRFFANPGAPEYLPSSITWPQQICGWYNNPRPSTAAPWRTFNVSNATSTLQQWGYHSTFSLAGGGWTRAQTWNPSVCATNTFRDHAYTTGNNTIREQNYSGWQPRGEPNPEVYALWWWPYPDWPAYVYWWHSTH